MQGKYSAVGRRNLLEACSLALLLVAGSGLFSSCAKKGPSAQSAVKRPATGTATQTPSPDKGPTVQRAISQRIKADSPAPKALPKAPQLPLAASIRAFGLGQGSNPRIAWDFSLGPLESSSLAREDEAAVLEVARRFMDALSAGKLDPELLLPSSREALSVLLAPAPQAADAQASPYRLGAISIHGDDASLKVRLASATPPADPQCLREEGLLSLRKEDGSWYIEALALDMPKSGSLAFDPSNFARTNNGH